jgi:hypothetical protein
MIDEKSRRKPNFDERNAAPVVFADGQTWYLPKPWLEIRPVFRDGRAAAAYPVPTCGTELDALIEAVAGADDRLAQVAAVATLAAELMSWHYDLSDADLDQLLAFRLANEASMNWIREVFAIATGQSGPKVYSAGGD